MFQCNLIRVDYREIQMHFEIQWCFQASVRTTWLSGNSHCKCTLKFNDAVRTTWLSGNSHCIRIKLSTPWSSRAVPQPSTDLALHRFAVEFRWDPAFSMQYGRRLHNKLLPMSLGSGVSLSLWLSGTPNCLWVFFFWGGYYPNVWIHTLFAIM